LRSVDIQPVTYQGQQMYLFRDPLELTDYQLILTPALAQMAAFCDGTRDSHQIQSDLHNIFEIDVNLELIDETLEKLDEANLFENARTKELEAEQLSNYRAQPYRVPALAGQSYPADPADLTETLDAFGDEDDLDGWQPWTGRGIISPHIDYFRGGQVYSKVWTRAEAAVKEAELVLMFGTDHNGGFGRLNLTGQSYATPWGVIPTDTNLVDRLAQVLGPDVYDEELHHRTEHSIELSAIWLHHIRGQDPCPMVPILCGSFYEFIANGGNPAEDEKISRFIDTLREATTGKKVLAVASVDLAHVGPNFGDDFVIDEARQTTLRESDRDLMAAIALGDAERFYYEVAAVDDQNRICGFSSIYLLLRYLGQTMGTQIAYEHCPADAQDQSFVSICGILLK